MKSKTSSFLLVATFFAHSLLATEPVKEEEAAKIGEEAYIYGYPLVLLEVTKSFDTNVECISSTLPVGLGDPMYAKLEAKLAEAMLSLPATKGFEIGKGFEAARMRGSEHNDSFEVSDAGAIVPASNRAGGTLGGISTGAPLVMRVAFKPTSSIRKTQQTVDREGKSLSFSPPENSRNDPCVAIRAVPIVEAMAALVLADALLLQRCARL